MQGVLKAHLTEEPHSAEMFKAQSRTRLQNPESRLKRKANHLTPSDLPFPKKSKIPFENEATTQRASLGPRRMENKMIGSRCPRPNPTVLHVNPRTCMRSLQLPHEASITARISWYQSGHVCSVGIIGYKKKFEKLHFCPQKAKTCSCQKLT
jgi:hypothetical protein